MPKRFTETTKWDDPWFVELEAELKLFWMYLCDKCDNSGVIDISKRITGLLINGKIDVQLMLDAMVDSKRLIKLENGKYWVKDFIAYQFGELQEQSNLHKNVINLLKHHKLYDKYIKGSFTLNEGLSKGPSIVKVKYSKGKEEFEKFRLVYPGTKKGLDTEFDNFTKKHKNWEDILPILSDRLIDQMNRKDRLNVMGAFVPEWKNLQTWINQKSWEEEIPISDEQKAEKHPYSTCKCGWRYKYKLKDYQIEKAKATPCPECGKKVEIVYD